jgi:hypothetical protein
VDQEKLRVYTRMGILLFFSAMFASTIIRHTGLEDGNIAPMTVYSFLSGLLAGKLIDFYMSDKKPDDVIAIENIKKLKKAEDRIKELEDERIAKVA